MSFKLAVVITGDRHLDHHKTMESVRNAKPDEIHEYHPETSVKTINEILDKTKTDAITVVQSGDTVITEAFDLVRDAMALGADFVYTDEEFLTDEGWRQPWLKPGWSPIRLTTQAYTGRLWAARLDLLAETDQNLPPEAWELAWVLRSAHNAKTRRHIPKITYRGQREGGAQLFSSSDKGTSAAAELFTQYSSDLGAQIQVSWDGNIQRHYAIPRLENLPFVSIIIPSAGKECRPGSRQDFLVVNAVRSVLESSTYKNLEIVVVLDSHAPAAVREQLWQLNAGQNLRISRYDKPFNFSAKINNGAAIAKHEYLLLLNDDTEVDSPSWIEEMLAFESIQEVSAVGAMLRYPSGLIQHAGVSTRDGDVGHPYIGYPSDTVGYQEQLVHPVDVIATTGACILIHRSHFEAVGGLSEEFPINFNDVDFCFKLHKHGLRCVVTPNARLWHDESSTREAGRVYEGEHELLLSRWESILKKDPLYKDIFWPDRVPRSERIR